MTPTPTATPTPSPTPTATPIPASFEVHVDAPEEVEINQEWSWTVAIENTGEVEGTFRTDVSFKTPDSDWQTIGTIERAVGPGAIETYRSDTGSFPYISTITYRLEKPGIEFDIQVLTRTLAFGETYRSPDNILITVEKVELTQAYTYLNYQGEQAQEEASPGYQWALIWLRAENDTGSTAYLPFEGDFPIRVGNQQYDRQFIRKDKDEYDSGEVGPGIVREGWIGYEIPTDLSRSDLIVEHFDSDFRNEWGVRWSE